jgi:hypothetical protein
MPRPPISRLGCRLRSLAQVNVASASSEPRTRLLISSPRSNRIE